MLLDPSYSDFSIVRNDCEQVGLAGLIDCYPFANNAFGGNLNKINVESDMLF